VLVLLGGPGATFGGPTTIATGVDPISVAVGEFNQDGDPDLGRSGGRQWGLSMAAYGEISMAAFTGRRHRFEARATASRAPFALAVWMTSATRGRRSQRAA